MRVEPLDTMNQCDWYNSRRLVGGSILVLCPTIGQHEQTDRQTERCFNMFIRMSRSFTWLALALLLLLGSSQAQTGDQGCVQIQAALNYRGDCIYLFHGDDYVKFDMQGHEIRTGSNRHFGGFQGHVDAAVTWSGNGNMYLFQGSRYFKNAMLIMGPWDTSKWDSDFTDGIDAAGNRNGMTYFFKGCSVIGMSSKKRLRDEVLDSEDIGLPCHVDAAFSLDDALYVIKGNQVWRWAQHVGKPVPLTDVLHMTSWEVCQAE